MLQSIRESAQGVVAWFIVILISVPFALWGIQEYFGVGSESIIASVNSQEITEQEFERSYRFFRQNLRERLGSSYRPELIDETQLRKEVLDAMVRNRVIMQALSEMGLAAGDDLVRSAIRTTSSFQAGGVFNQTVYERSVQQRGLTPSGFEAQVRDGIVRQQLPKAISGSAFATQAEMNELVRLRQQQRELSYLEVSLSTYLNSVDADENEVRAHYDSHESEFMAPERVKVNYLELDVASIASAIGADDEALRGYYDQHKSEYITAEQRRASHIMIALDGGSDESAVTEAREAAEAALQRLNDGEDFADLAKELSQDPGSSDTGGDLGFMEKGIMDPELEKAMFSLAEGGIGDVVRSEFGFHVLKLTAIRPPEGKSFDDASVDLKSAYLKDKAERLFYEYVEQLSDLAYEDPDSLEPAADALGMQIKESEWFSHDGGKGVAESLKVVSTAFSEDVMTEGHNSEAIELGAEHVVVLRVLEHEEAAVKEFDRVKDDIKNQIKRDKAANKAKEKGEAIFASLKQGATFQQVADDNDLMLNQKGAVDRDNRDVPGEILNRLFTMLRPEEGKSSYDQVGLANGDFAVIALDGVIDGTIKDAQKLGGEAALQNALARSRGESYFQHLVQNKRGASDIQLIQKEE
ncbi:SurA N-terminal domain-containing protein [Candidatus Vondammii sp. HM_W22]|uniref:SurA N-terminal domain-containing protein n=1 Tax=Candidatus Vondammii sp. HM_W22 TaxID=2687299 RepID=UPI001F1474D1|nr:SurA N-terminal domain-containing protein [Candidatus Vondammii sp. HM_W22]